MGLAVSLSLGEPPHITVAGQTVETLGPAQLDDLLGGRADLRARVRRRLGHGRPDGVHLSDADGLPDKLRGVFARHGWQPATLVHRAHDARILADTAQPLILAAQLAENPSREASTQTATISCTVVNTVARETHWHAAATVAQTVSYTIAAAAGKLGGRTALSFTAGYGRTTGTSESVEVGSAAGVEAVLPPGRAVVFELGATARRLEARVTYARRLTGGILVRYGRRKGGRRCWYVPLARLYDPATLVRHQRETLKVAFHARARTTQRDPRPDERA